MNFLLAALAKECQKNMLREKILVVPSYQSGHVLCESLSLSGTGWVNFDLDSHIKLLLKAGEINLRAMELLDRANVEKFGEMEPTEVQ